ncbi:hypothetical protein, partial [Bilophila wadsworthia]|uniref:hypothetical protein n=1 Tax=Bilophila wadsworthia TaxID=35833 RepID=UPI003A85C470
MKGTVSFDGDREKVSKDQEMILEKKNGKAKASPSALLQSSNVPGDFIPALCRYRISRTFTSTLGDSMKSLSTLP